MGDAQCRTAFDQRLTFNINCPDSGTAPASVFSLLTAGQQAELANYVAMIVRLTPVGVALRHFHALGNGPTWTLSANSNMVGTAADTQTSIPVQNGDKKIFIQSTAAAMVVQVAIDCVTKDNIV